VAVSRETQGQIQKGDYDSIEAAWLERIETTPDDLDFFVGTARALIGVGEEKRARSLLELLDDQFKEQGRWRTRLQLLRRAGSLIFAAADRQHLMVVATLQKLYADKPSFQGLLESVGLKRAVEDIPKTWEKVERLETLLGYDVGAVVAMEGKGVGRVTEVNLGLESFKIDFERHAGLMVGFRAAGKLLRPLAENHFLRRKLEDPAGLAALRDDSPAELLRLVLESAGRALTGAEIKDMLQGLVADDRWTSFWTAARKHPQVVASGGGRQSYHWATSSEGASDSVWRSFEKASDEKKIDLLRRNADRDPELRGRMAKELVRIGEEIARTKPGLAFEIWFALERTGGAPAGLSWEPDALLAAGRDPRPTLTGIGERLLRERGYAMVRERRDDWPAVYADMLWREDDPRALNLLAEGLEHESSEDFGRFIDQLVAQPRKAPAAFVWLAERAVDDEEIQARNPLRLLQQILAAMVTDEFAGYRQRLKPLADSGGALPRLFAKLSEDQAPQAREAVQRSPALEDYQRAPLLAALEMRFAGLRQEQEMPLYATAESIAARRAELKRLLDVEIPANRKAIEEARALGDLRENFEYKSARQRHEYLAARSASLDRDLRRVRPLDPGKIDPSEVRIGTRVRLGDGKGGERPLTILGPWESRPEENIVSYESDLARGILGKRAGDAVEVEGRGFTILAIEPYQ